MNGVEDTEGSNNHHGSAIAPATHVGSRCIARPDCALKVANSVDDGLEDANHLDERVAIRLHRAIGPLQEEAPPPINFDLRPGKLDAGLRRRV